MSPSLKVCYFVALSHAKMSAFPWLHGFSAATAIVQLKCSSNISESKYTHNSRQPNTRMHIHTYAYSFSHIHFKMFCNFSLKLNMAYRRHVFFSALGPETEAHIKQAKDKVRFDL